jgi:hypothetical protein
MPLTIGNTVGGVYWKPIYNLLEDDFEILVINAQHLKTVLGRKTDVKDSEWIADLLQHGLLDRFHSLSTAAGIARTDALTDAAGRGNCPPLHPS